MGVWGGVTTGVHTPRRMGIQLDSNTLMFSIGILSLLMAFISWTFPATITDRDFGLKVWAVGICCVGFSSFSCARRCIPSSGCSWPTRC